MKLSANLGYLWPELELLDAIRAAHRAGFAAVEVHWPYITHAIDVALVLEEHQMPLVSLNTVAGDLANGEFGLAALPGREQDARAAIDKALAYALDVSARNIHVLAGITPQTKAATSTFGSNLAYAADRAAAYGIGVLIEPLSTQPGYFLTHVDQAAEVIGRVGVPNLRLLFDFFHVAMTEGDPLPAFERHIDLVGHVQIAAVPDRSEPDHGEIDFPVLIHKLEELGYEGYVGAEYRPATTTDEGLAWMDSYLSPSV